MTTPFQHTPSGPVVFGPGSAATVGDKTLLKKHTAVLLLTDATVAKAGLVDGVRASLGDRVAIEEHGVVADGDCAFVEDLAVRCIATGVTAICAVGGGSVIDAAKGVAAVMATGKKLAELEGVAKVRARTVPVVAIPTTSGTGSEATQFAVIKDHAAHTKRILVDTNLIPALAVLDPQLLVGLPAGVTRATAVDALTHALEATVSRMANPIGIALAAEAVRLLVAERGLARALAAPDDLSARSDCLMAAHLAGQAVNSCMLGACHAIAHVVGATAGVPHGIANGLFLTDVMRANAARVGTAYLRLAPHLGVSGDATIDAVIAAVDAFVFEVGGVPRRLRDAAPSLAEGDLARLATAAALDPDLPTNPVRIDEAGLLSILQARW